MNSQDALVSHIISQTITSLSFLQSQGIIGSSTELDQVRNQLIARQHGGGIASGMAGMSIGAGARPSQPQQQPQPQLQHQSFGQPPRTMSSPQAQPRTEAMIHTPSIPGLPPRRAPSISTEPEQRDRAVALWDYDSQAHGDLAFKKDDVIVVDEEVNPEWYRGHLESDPSRQGLFPHNYIQRLVPSNAMTRTDSHMSHQSHSQYSTSHSLPPTQPMYAGQPQQGAMMPYQAQHPPTLYQQLPPPPPPSHSYAMTNQPAGSIAPVEESGKKSRFKLKPDGKATHFAHSAVGGLGFGAGVGVASSLVNNSE